MPLGSSARLRRFLVPAAAFAAAVTVLSVGLSLRAQETGKAETGKPAPKADPAGKADTKTPPEPKPEPDPKVDPKPDPKDLKTPDPKDRPVPVPDEKEKRPPPPDDGIDLKVLLRRQPGAVGPAAAPTTAQLPKMVLRGWVRTVGKPPAALLEISGVARFQLVREGMELPVSVVGRLPSSFLRTPDGRTADSVDREQIRLRVRKVSAEGIELDHPLFAEPLIVR